MRATARRAQAPRSSAVAPLALSLAAVLAGCSAAAPHLRDAEPGTLAKADDVKEWESLARPDTLAMLLGFVWPTVPTNDTCPVVERRGSATLLTGDCVTKDGRRAHGQAEMFDDGGQRRVRMRGFGVGRPIVTGFATMRGADREGSEALSYALDLHVVTNEEDTPAEWFAARYRGRKDANGWHGRGEIAVSDQGVVRAHSDGVTFDGQRCKTEPTAGRTELNAGGHTVQIDYDGATACSKPGAAPWTLDGKAQPNPLPVSGAMSCAVVGPGTSRGGLGWLLLLLLPISRRLRRPRRAPR